jgi:cytochrome b561
LLQQYAASAQPRMAYTRRPVLAEAATPRYTRSAIFLHWLTAALIVVSVCVGLYMVGLKLSPLKLKLYSWHKWVGVTIFLLAAARLVWRAWHPAPPLPADSPQWQRVAAAINHWSLYVLLICIPISGWLMSSAFGVPVKYFGVVPLPDLVDKNKELAESLKLLHEVLVYTMLALVAMHIAAAIKHHVMDRDDVLHRMLPLVKPRR